RITTARLCSIPMATTLRRCATNRSDRFHCRRREHRSVGAVNPSMPIEPPEIPPATPGNPTIPPAENPPGNPRPEVPPPVHEPGEPPRPDELPGKMPDGFSVRGPNRPRTPNPATDTGEQ